MTEPQAAQHKPAGCRRVMRGCLTSLAWLGLGILIMIPLIYFIDRYEFYQKLGADLEFGPPCYDAGHGYIGRVKPEALTAEARALLLQWPRKLWPIGYYMRIEGDKITLKYIVYVLFLNDLLKQTSKDVAEIYRLTGREFTKDASANSMHCDNYVIVGTKKGIANAWSLSDTYDFLMSMDTKDYPPWRLIEFYLGRDIRDFRALLFEMNIDPFTGQPLPPPPDAPSAKSAP